MSAHEGWRLRTLAAHAGREELRAQAVHASPIDLSTTYPLGELDAEVAALDDWSKGARHAGNPIYARVFNQTVARFETAIAALEGTSDAVAFSSGMAALSALLVCLSQQGGRHLAAIRPLYGTSDHLLAAGLFGLDVTWTTPAQLAGALRGDTCCVLLETPQNPTLGLVDIAAVAAQAAPVPVLVDNTLATPVLQRPVRHGACFVLHSATKFIGGHGDTVGGIIATGEQWARPLRQVRFATGALLHPFAAYLLHRGIPTLPLRVGAAQASAQVLARRLAGHPAVRRVRYPSLDGQADRLIGAQMLGPGTLLAIELDSEDTAKRFLSSLRLALHAVSLGTFDTLVEHPASMTHRVMDSADRAASGIRPTLVRIAVGLEDPDDLWADIAQALGQTAPRTGKRVGRWSDGGP
jgi:methionine-gamma-lyase